MREHLEKLAAHLEGIDSSSADAKAIRWALEEIDSLEARLADSQEQAASSARQLDQLDQQAMGRYQE